MSWQPSDLRAAAGPVRYTLLSTLCHVRDTEITDSLVELSRQGWHPAAAGGGGARGAGRHGPQGDLSRSRESTLKALAAEAAAHEARYRARVRTVLRSSYSNHWRRILSPLLNALELKCNNTAYRPAMDAIDLLKRYLDQLIAKEG